MCARCAGPAPARLRPYCFCAPVLLANAERAPCVCNSTPAICVALARSSVCILRQRQPDAQPSITA